MSQRLNHSPDMDTDYYFVDRLVEPTDSEFDLPDWQVRYMIQKKRHPEPFLFLQRKDSIGEPYAVGKIIMHRCSDSLGRTRVTHEATSLAQIPPHPNIIKLYSSYVDVPRPGKDIIILEYCAGGDLFYLTSYAWHIQRRIPEVFVWHVLCQTLITMKHLDRNQISHSKLSGGGSGHLLLRPVEGDAYPDIVLAYFGYCQTQNERRKRYDFECLGTWIDWKIINKSDEVVDETTPYYSQELKNFVDVLYGRGYDGELPPLSAETEPLSAETERELIPLAKKQAYGGAKTTEKMPEWMIAYFNELRSRKESPRVLLDSDAESSAQVSAAPGSDS